MQVLSHYTVLTEKVDKMDYFDEHDEGDSTCPDCGGEMTWCESCRMWTQLCCEEYGTCMCA